MEHRQIGSLEVSVIGLGCNNFGMSIDEAATAEVVAATLDAGVNFFDTADSYGPSEEWLGKALAGRRDEAVIATKFASRVSDELPGGGAPDYVRSAVDRSLRRLGIDCIDLYQMHRPDPDTPIGDTLAALDEQVRAGKVREIGCSNFSAAQLREAAEAVEGGAAARFVSVQNHYNLLHRDDEAEVLPECEALGLGYLPYFPLASGLLSGKYRRGEEAPADTRLGRIPRLGSGLLTDETFDTVDQLTAWATKCGRSLLELAIAWLAAKPTVASVIAGATSPVQIHANAAAGSLILTPDDVAEIDALVA